MTDNLDVDRIVQQFNNDTLFTEMSGYSLAHLIPHAHTITIQSGETIVSAGEPANDLFFLVSGELELKWQSGSFRVSKPRRIGDESIIGLPNYLMTITAKDVSEIIRIPSKQINEILISYPHLATRATEDLLGIISGQSIQKMSEIKDSAGSGNVWRDLIGWTVSIIGPLSLLITMHIAEAPQSITYFSVLLLSAACLWVFSLVDEFIPPLFVISSTIALALAPANIALKGFGSEALFLFVGVYGLGIVLEDSGLFYRLMLTLLSRAPDGSIWQRILLILAGYIISPVISSGNSRVSMVIPLYKAMLECLAIQKQSLSSTSLATASFSGAMLMSPMFLTSKPSNLVVIGLLPTEMKEQFSSFYWFYAALICAGLVTLFHFIADRSVYGQLPPTQIPRGILRKQIDLLGPVTAIEWSACICLIFFIGGAATTQWHHLTLSQISSLLLVYLLIYGLIKKKSFQNRIDWAMIFFLLSLDGLTAIMNYLKFSDFLIDHMPNFIPYLQNSNVLFIFFVCSLVVIIRLILPTTAGMITSALILIPLAPAIGVSAWVVGFLCSLFSDIWIFPYQSSTYTQFRNKAGDKSGSYSERLFLFHNYILNIARLVAALISIPYWNWLGLL